jgi:hypothetical protein
MTGAGDTSEIDEFTLDEAEDVADESADVADDVEDDDESGDGTDAPLPDVGVDVQLNTDDPDPTAGGSDIGGVTPGPGDG